MSILIDKSNSKGLYILLIFTFVMVIGFEMIMPLIIGHFVIRLKFSATAVATALAVRQFSQQGLAMVGGSLADRYDVRKLIAMGVLLRAIGFVSLAYAQSYIALVIAMIVIGFGGVLFEMPYQTALASLTNDNNRSRYYSLNNTVTGVASTIGPLIGAVLLVFDFSIVCFGAAICFLVNFFVSILAMPKIMRKEKKYSAIESVKVVSKDKSFIFLVVLMIVFWLAASQINVSFPIHLERLSKDPQSIGVMWAIYAALTALFQYPTVALLQKRFSARQSIVIGILLIALALLLVPFATSQYLFFGVVILFTFGMLIARPNQQTVAVAMSDKSALGMYLGVNSMAFAIGSGVGAIMGGFFLDLSIGSPAQTASWYLYAGIAIIATVGFAFNHKIGAKKGGEVVHC